LYEGIFQNCQINFILLNDTFKVSFNIFNHLVVMALAPAGRTETGMAWKTPGVPDWWKMGIVPEAP